MLKIYKASKNAIELLSMMLEKSPDMRINAYEALKHPFFEEKEIML